MKVVGLAPFYNVESAHYPYLESIISTMPLVDKMVVNDGGCLDNTINNIKKLRDNVYPNIEIIDFKHKQSKMWKGLDDAIEHCLDKIDADWVIEVQADEYFRPKDYPKIREEINKAHKEEYNGIRQLRHHTTWNGVEGDYNYYIIRIFRNKDNLVSYAGGDCFYFEGKEMKRDGFQTHNLPPELDSEVPFYHFKGIPMNLKIQSRRHKEHYAKGHPNRTKSQKNLQRRLSEGNLPPVDIKKEDINEVVPELYHGLLDYNKSKYTVREELFDKEFLKELGYVND